MLADFVETSLHRVFRFNPCVAVHELRLRMSGVRPFVVLFFYTLAVGMTVFIALALQTWQQHIFYGGAAPGSDLGGITFAVLAYTQLTLILFVLPAYAAGAITLEREKQTLEMLRATLLTPGDIVSGKFLVVVAFGGVLLFASLPVATWCLLLGGVDPAQVFYVYTFLFVVVGWVSALGLLLSSGQRKTIGAIVGTYLIVLFICAVTPILLGVIVQTLTFHSGAMVPPVMGDVGASAILLSAGLLGGWLLFVALRLLWSRLLGRRGSWIGPALAAVTAVGVGLFLAFSPGPSVYSVLSGAPMWSLLVLNPYGGLAAVLGPGAAAFLTSGMGATGSAHLQLCVWAIVLGAFLLMALALWARSVSLFRAQRFG